MNLSNKGFNRLVIGAVAIGFVALALAAGSAVWAVRQNQAYAALVNHTYEVERTIADFRVVAERLEAARRGYLLQPRDKQFLETYRQAASDAPIRMQRLRALTADNPSQKKRLDALGQWLLFDLVLTDRSVDKVSMGGQVPAIREFQADNSADMLRNIRLITETMSAEENRLLIERRNAQKGTLITLYGMLSIAGILLLFVGTGSLWIINRYTRDLTRSKDALAVLNEGLEIAVRDRTADLRRANDEIQRFAYIVSHDLRSPLVNVTGFTSEMETGLATLTAAFDEADKTAPGAISREAKEVVRADLPEAIGFIKSSTRKMDRLINAILALSRQGRRVLVPETLDMTKLLSAVADSLRQRADKAGARIVLEGRVPDIVSDRIAVDQVFSNLLENAVKYSKPGQPNTIVVRGEEQLGRVVFEVSDQGRGIDPKDHERIFELFRRAGVQDQTGEGIGLAHVRALIYRLGGVINCQSEIGSGATFRVSLPPHLMPEQGTLP